jgi:hypothetical protein
MAIPDLSFIELHPHEQSLMSVASAEDPLGRAHPRLINHAVRRHPLLVHPSAKKERCQVIIAPMREKLTAIEGQLKKIG